MKKHEVWYMKPEFIRDGMMGSEWLVNHDKMPNATALERTHVLLKEDIVGEREAIFAKMQAEHWSPNGEARPLIEKLGLRHTSMSVGDILRETESKRCWLVDTWGFEELRR